MTATRSGRKAKRKKATKTGRKKPSAGRKSVRKKGVTKKTRKRPDNYRGMTQQTRAARIIDALAGEYPDAHCQLNFSSPFELLIATILAAQCTDAMVNRVTPDLFRRYPTPQDFVDAPPEDIEQAIFKTGFYRNKTRSIQKCCRTLVENHAGEVPSTMEELVALGGVGRKTANCVLGNAFGVPGLVVDTHVKRITYRMGLTAETDPDKIERDLNDIIEESAWTRFSHYVTDHGRAVCTARAPQCDECVIQDLCPRVGVEG
jgi:endonuclease-3